MYLFIRCRTNECNKLFAGGATSPQPLHRITTRRRVQLGAEVTLRFLERVGVQRPGKTKTSEKLKELGAWGRVAWAANAHHQQLHRLICFLLAIVVAVARRQR